MRTEKAQRPVYVCSRCGSRLAEHGSHQPGWFRCPDGMEAPWSGFTPETPCTPPAPDPEPCAESTCPHTAQACPHDHVIPPAAAECPHGYAAPINCGLCAGVDG